MAGTKTLVHLLARTVNAQPDACALVAADQRVTYGQLWRSVGRAAHGLAQQGVAPGDRVALLMRNSPEYVACYYGVLACGGTVVPLNQEAKARDLAAWIAHAGARLVVADARHPERAALTAMLAGGAAMIAANALTEEAPQAIDLDRVAPGGDQALAALLYTSGTTGQPKGVMLSHANLASNMLAIVEYLGLGPSDRVLSALPFFYSYGNSVLHTHLAAGGTVVIETSMMYPQRTVEAMRREQVTGFSGVPWMFTSLLTHTSFGQMRDDLPSLRYFTQAGAPMAPADIARVRAAFPAVDFFVMYGQTEATARLSFLPPADLDLHAGSIGRAIPGVTLQIRREDGRVAQAGEAGEVFAAGPNIMLGYWNAPEATRAVIADEPNGRWLRTGDIGYADADGYLFLVGRSAEIIKTGAHRVSPLEIEEAALRLDGLLEAAAFGVPDAQAGEAIHLAVVERPGSGLTERDVLAHCRGQLSLYKMPRRVIFKASLPRTASGKLQRRALADQTTAEAGTWAH
jgi:long-chain acyl-CoA synthetase